MMDFIGQKLTIGHFLQPIIKVLSHLGLPTGFPALAPARSPPEAGEAGSQADASAALYDGIDPPPPDDAQASIDD